MTVAGKIIYGLQVTAIGLVVVFLGLTILICAVKIMGMLMEKSTAKKEAKAKAELEAAAKKAAAEAAAAPVVEPEPEEVTDDSELIAVITAALAAYMGSDKQLVVRKVRRVPGWNRTARAEQVYRF